MNNDYLLTTVEGADIAVIGLGCVGLPLAIEFGKEYNVLGFDINVERVSDLQSGKDRTQEADLKRLKAAMETKKVGQIGLFFYSETEDLRSYNISC